MTTRLEDLNVKTKYAPVYDLVTQLLDAMMKSKTLVGTAVGDAHDKDFDIPIMRTIVAIEFQELDPLNTPDLEGDPV